MEFTQGAPFDSFGLSEATMRAIRNKGYEISTPVQAGCIPPMLAGKDVIAKAPTGTGKTMAFGIPIIERIDPDGEDVQAVILAPTRELAMQITDEMRQIAVCHEGVRLVCLYGGQPIAKQINALKRRPQIVVATPGRLSDHMKRRTVTLGQVQTVVLDEADRMLDMGFIHDVTRILDKIPHRRNLGMFSATISREVMDISWVYQRDPEEITVQATRENKPDILQYRIEVPSDKKVDAIAAIIRAQQLDRVICFCNTKGSTERLTKFCSCGDWTPNASTATFPSASGRRSWPGSGTGSFMCSWPRTWPAGASTWTTWTRCSTSRCRRKTSIISIASAAPAGPGSTAWHIPCCRTSRPACGWTISPATPAARSSPPFWARTAR